MRRSELASGAFYQLGVVAVSSEINNRKGDLGRVLIKEVFDRAFADSIHAPDLARFELAGFYELKNRKGVELQYFRRAFYCVDWVVHLRQS